MLNRESQKQIVIGQRGEQIKAVGVRARDKIEKFLREKVFLQLTGMAMCYTSCSSGECANSCACSKSKSKQGLEKEGGASHRVWIHEQEMTFVSVGE